MKRKVIGFLGISLAISMVVFSCATTGGRSSVDGFSLDEAIEQSAVEVIEELAAGTRVAIVAFSSEHDNLSNYIMDELTGELVDGSLEVADRRNLEYVYNELNFQMSGDVSDETAISIGKFLGVRYVITGQLVKAGDRYRYRLSGINVETAVQESSTRLNVCNDRTLQSLIADVRQTQVVTASAGYGREQASVAPKTAGAFLDRGILFASRGDFELAIAELTEAIQLNGNLVTAYVLRGRAIHASAVKVTGIGANFSTVTSTGTGGKVTETQRQAFDRSISDFNQAIRLDPNNAIAYRERGKVYDDKGDYDRGIADCNQAIRLNPNYALAYRERGFAYNGKGDYDRAIADYSQAIRLDPNDVVAYNNRGNLYIRKGDYDRAITDYSQVVRLDPNDAQAYANRGVAYHNKGDYARARTDYGKALQLDPNDTNTRNNLNMLGDRGR
jgi:tetratricopeptide (TPR) repeat protein